MSNFPYTLAQLKKMATFIYILLCLLLLNLVFNLNFEWSGVSLIVRIYLFVFSFYLIYNYAMDDLDQVKEDYRNIYLDHFEWRLVLETRIFPFAFIYCITIVFTMIDYLQNQGWPWNPITSLLNGRYTNTVIYSLFLLFILKLKKRPLVTIPLFFIVSIVYFLFDKTVSSMIFAGGSVFAFKISKLILFSFFVIWDFTRTKSRVVLFAFLSILASLVLYVLIIGAYYLGFTYAEQNTYLRQECGLRLARFGLPVALTDLQAQTIRTRDIQLLSKVSGYLDYYNMKINYSSSQWQLLLFSSGFSDANIVSRLLLKEKKSVNYEKLIPYILEEIKVDKDSLLEQQYLLRLAAQSIEGKELEFMDLLIKSNKKFFIWGMYVLGENREIRAIPFLIKRLTHVEDHIANAAYTSLVQITGFKPKKNNTVMKKNSPFTIKAFKKFYLDKNRD